MPIDPPSPNPMIELLNVSKRFGSFVAVDNVSLRIEAGEFITLLGPSGCGKTTILRMLSGFETPSWGSVFLAGSDVTRLPPYKRDVNQVFQSYALFPHLNVADNIAFGLRMKKVPRNEITQRVADVVDIVSLKGFERRMPQQLSGGQRQRVALARAIVMRPKVLLLDEPLSALDAKLRHAMQLELKSLQQRLGITFVFVTHDQEEALTMSDRIAIINKGKVEQIGIASEMYHRPRTRFVANFIGQANILEAAVTSRHESGGEVMLLLGGEIRLRVPVDAIPPAATNVLLSIRPERLHLQRQMPATDDNTFPAKVVSEIFKGPLAQLTLSTTGGLTLTAVVANESRLQEPFHPGDAIYCHLHPDDIVILDDPH